MKTIEREIIYYQTLDGKIPFKKWYLSIKDSITRNKIDARITRLELGNFGHCNSIGHGLMELKIDYGPGFRVYFGQSGHNIIILLCGGNKNSQTKDIQLAHEYWENYRRQYENT